MFFQALPFWKAQYYSGFGDRNKAHDNRQEGVAVLWDCFVNNFNHEYPFLWFDRELKKFTGIDVYKKRISDKGFCVHENEKFNVLLMDLKYLNSNARAVSEFLGEPIDLLSSNSGERKWYAEAYREFKTRYMEEYKDAFSKYLNTEFSKWYYND